jgi:amino acid permease
MTLMGWVTLITSLAFVWMLTLWCFYKVLSIKEDPPQPVKDFHSA